MCCKIALLELLLTRDNAATAFFRYPLSPVPRVSQHPRLFYGRNRSTATQTLRTNVRRRTSGNRHPWHCFGRESLIGRHNFAKLRRLLELAVTPDRCDYSFDTAQVDSDL